MPLFRLALRALLVGALPSFLAAQAPVSTAAQQVRSARARYNDAIAKRDMVAMAAALAPAYHLVAGRSAQSHGIEAMQARWASAFAGDSLYACVRTPDAIMPNASWGLAQERGTWHCTYAGVPKGAKPGRATGVYDAKWQRDVSGTWRLQAEVFTTLTCEGGSASCIPPDVIAGTPRGTAERNTAQDNMVRAVRAARTAYNGAIARGQADTIAALFAPGYHAVFGRGTHIEDDSSARADWQQEFRDNGPGSCVRTPDEIVVNGSWAIAHERGTWQCRSGHGRDRIRPSGSYVAKWQRDEARQWRVQTEVFTTLRCEGATAKCEPPAPLPIR